MFKHQLLPAGTLYPLVELSSFHSCQGWLGYQNIDFPNPAGEQEEAEAVSTTLHSQRKLSVSWQLEKQSLNYCSLVHICC